MLLYRAGRRRVPSTGICLISFVVRYTQHGSHDQSTPPVSHQVSNTREPESVLASDRPKACLEMLVRRLVLRFRTGCCGRLKEECGAFNSRIIYIPPSGQLSIGVAKVDSHPITSTLFPKSQFCTQRGKFLLPLAPLHQPH